MKCMLKGRGKTAMFELGRQWQNGQRLDLEHTQDTSQTKSKAHIHTIMHPFDTVSRAQNTAFSQLLINVY